MPFNSVKSNSINYKKSVLGRIEGIKNASLLEATTESGETISVYELILSYPAAETVTNGKPGSIISGEIYLASNLKANAKPCHGIILDDGNAGDIIQIKIAGLHSSNTALTADKDVYLRNTGVSQTPLVATSVSEDGFQKLGTAINTNVLLIDIKPFQQIT